MCVDHMTNTPSRRSATGSNSIRLKAVRTDRDKQCPQIDAGFVARGLYLVALPENKLMISASARERGVRFA
jgi:hypothetical protein